MSRLTISAFWHFGPSEDSKKEVALWSLRSEKVFFLFRSILVVKELYTQLDLCSANFRRSIYSSYMAVSAIIRRLSSVEFQYKKKMFLIFFPRSYGGLKFLLTLA